MVIPVSGITKYGFIKSQVINKINTVIQYYIDANSYTDTSCLPRLTIDSRTTHSYDAADALLSCSVRSRGGGGGTGGEVGEIPPPPVTFPRPAVLS